MTSSSGKQIVFAGIWAAVHLTTFLAWHAAVKQVAVQQYEDYWLFIGSVSGLILSAGLFGLFAVFVKNGWLAYGTILFSFIFSFLVVWPSTVVFAFMGTASLFALFGAWRMANEFSFSLGFSVAKIFRAGLSTYFTAAALICSLYYVIEIRDKDAIAAILPKPAFDITIRAAAEPLKALTGGIEVKPDSTVDEFLESVILGQLKREGVPVDRIPASEIRRLVADQRADLMSRYGLKLRGDEHIADAFRTTIVSRVQDLLGPYRAYLPLASAIAFFLAFKTLAFSLYFISLLVAYVLVYLMTAVGFIKQETQHMDVQRLVL